MKFGFTLLELILTIAILVILAAAGFGFYYNFFLETKLKEETYKIISILKTAQQKAISGENFSSWGVYFSHLTNDQYYELFWGNSYSQGTTTEKHFLPSGLVFEIPSASSSLEIVFLKRSGRVNLSSSTLIKIKTEVSNISNSVLVFPSGIIE